MSFSGQYGWCVYGVDVDGKPRGVATHDEAEAVRVFWELADSHPLGKMTFYSEDRTLWLDENTRLVVMSRVDIGRAQALLARRREQQEAQKQATSEETPTSEEATGA